MTMHDIYLLSPELSLAGLATLVLLGDLIVKRKNYLFVFTIVGLAVPLAFTLALLGSLDGAALVENEGVLRDTLVVDKFALFFKLLLISVVAIVSLLSTDYVKRFEQFQTEFLVLLLYSATGMMLMASTKELITIYIALELSALPVAALAAFMRDGRSAESGLKFLILSGISSALLLYGMVLVFGLTGATQLDDIAERIANLAINTDEPFGSYALLMGVVLMIAGFGFKITAFPFQMWAPDVYEGAPTPVTAFLSVASKAAGFAVILRVFYSAFAIEELSIEWSAIFAVLAALSMTIGNLVAIAQQSVKRLLAYSTIAHAGYIMVGLAAVSTRAGGGDSSLGISAVLFYLSGYALMNLAVFSAVVAISNRIHSDAISDFAGMARRAPYLSAVLAFGLVSLTGIPPTVGFIAKVYVFGAAVDAGLEWLVIIGVLNSVIAAYYYFRIIKLMYLSEPPSTDSIESGIPIRLAMLVTSAGVLFFGLYPTDLLNFVKSAAQVLLSAS